MAERKKEVPAEAGERITATIALERMRREITVAADQMGSVEYTKHMALASYWATIASALHLYEGVVSTTRF